MTPRRERSYDVYLNYRTYPGVRKKTKGQWPIPNKCKRKGDEIRYRAKRKHLWNILRPPEKIANVSEKDRSSILDKTHAHRHDSEQGLTNYS